METDSQNGCRLKQIKVMPCVERHQQLCRVTEVALTKYVICKAWSANQRE